MSRGVNKVIIIGNVGRDPEMRYTQGGSPVANLSVATSEEWTDKSSNERKSATEWHRVVAFARLAEIIGEYVKKGSKVYIEGSLRTRQYDKDGVTHYATEIIARELQMLGDRASSENAGTDRPAQAPPAQSRAQTPGQRARQQRAPMDDDMDQEIPF